MVRPSGDRNRGKRESTDRVYNPIESDQSVPLRHRQNVVPFPIRDSLNTDMPFFIVHLGGPCSTWETTTPSCYSSELLDPLDFEYARWMG